MSAPRAITLTPRATAVLAGFGALLLALLAGQFLFIVQQRQIVDQQRDIAVRQERRAAPVLDATRALIGSGEDIRGAAARADRALGVTAQVLRSVRDTGLVRGTGRFLQAALDQDLVGVTTRALRRTPEIVSVLERAYPTLRASLDVQLDTRGMQRRSLAIQEQSLAVQRETLGLSRELRDIARQTLVHAESIDRKTGGTAPPVVVP